MDVYTGSNWFGEMFYSIEDESGACVVLGNNTFTKRLVDLHKEDCG